ncbi:MAG TPA: alpha/beta hydrolase [Polyangiaceae bacterium]|nr:alpha/beta hydrolase [Polyangiaceae bacterium]
MSSSSDVISKDGTRITFDRIGIGLPIVLVSGLLCDRTKAHDLAEQLSKQFTVISYDRRGRGDSTDTSPYSVERELEDLAALIADVGGAALVYGHSSGAGLALHAAASGLSITRLVLHEPPYSLDDEESKQSARELAEQVRAALAAERRGDAIELFFAATGMSAEMASEMSSDPALRKMAPTMSYDFEVMGESRGGTIPKELVRAIRVPTLVLAGGASPEFFRDIASQVAELLPNGTLSVLEDQDHAAPAEVVAPVVARFCAV